MFAGNLDQFTNHPIHGTTGDQYRLTGFQTFRKQFKLAVRRIDHQTQRADLYIRNDRRNASFV